MVKYDRKAVLVMERQRIPLRVEVEEVELLSRLVDAELDRRCQAIDDIIQRVYDIVPAKHTDKAIAEVKSAILVLVHSSLATLERKLAYDVVEPEEKPVEEVKPEEEAPPAEEPVPGKEPGKSKA